MRKNFILFILMISIMGFSSKANADTPFSDNFKISPPQNDNAPSPTPEPSTIILGVMGVAGALALRNRIRNKENNLSETP